MEQRRLRLGDILDDYCPRERRVTNHAVVAMIEDGVKQTRCTTCDAEHAYKGARVPKRRKKDSPDALYQEVLAGITDTELADSPVVAAAAPANASDVSPDDAVPPMIALPPVDVMAGRVHPESFERRTDMDENPPTPPAADETRLDARSEESEAGDDSPREDEAEFVDGPVHRRLIRATLPRPEGQKDARPVPDFTVRQVPPRGMNGHGSAQGTFRGDRTRMRGGAPPGNGLGNSHGAPSGNRPGGPRFHGGRPGGASRQTAGRTGAPSGFRGGSGHANGKRGRGSRG